MATSIATCKHVHRMLRSAFRSLETSLLTKNQLYYLIKKRINHEVQRKFHISSAIYAKKLPVDLSEIPVEQIRNFCIIAHVDHGKSTLADRLLEITGTIPKTASNKQVLDKLQVERERGITVKAQTASIFHEHNGKIYLLNLIDTPGHVDFNYEVSRSMKACDGVILLVDANQGIQAQTVANFFLAFESNLTVLPVINKIDLPGARPEEVKEQMLSMFEIDPEDVHLVSAKFGTGVSELLTKIIENIPPPKSSRKSPTRCLIFDSFYEQYRAAVCNVLVVDGQISKGDKIMSIATNKTYDIRDLGILYPEETPQETLYAGQVGFVVANMKKVSEAQVGDTLCHAKNPVEPLKGFKPAKQMVFAGVYPTDQSKLPNFREAIEKLTLNDSSASVIADSSPALGQGYRMGFLGLLHMDVFSQRLEQEFNASVIMTAPNVPFKVKIIGAKNIKHYGGEEVTILNPSQMPDSSIVKEYYEPLVLGTIITPEQNVYQVHELCKERRGRQTKEMKIDSSRVLIQCILPLQEILIDFFNALKAITSGYASFDYEEYGYQQADLVLMQFLLNGQPVEELTMIVNREKAREEGKAICAKLKEVIPPQLFLISIQAAIGSKILARENIKALRKDVTAKCYGGDVTRKNKLLKRQAEGKKRMRMFGKVQIPHNAFVEVLKKSV